LNSPNKTDELSSDDPRGRFLNQGSENLLNDQVGAQVSIEGDIEDLKIREDDQKQEEDGNQRETSQKCGIYTIGCYILDNNGSCCERPEGKINVCGCKIAIWLPVSIQHPTRHGAEQGSS
jgi:hypothetical protein